MYKTIISEFMRTYFNAPVLKKQMRWKVEGSWLNIEYFENLTYDNTTDPENWKYSLLCSQDVKDYCTIVGDTPVLNRVELMDRIHIMLFESLRSAKQDVNGLLKEGK